MSRFYLLLSLSIVFLSGCATNNNYQTRSFPISGGKKLWVAFNERGALPVKTSDVEIAIAGFTADKEKKELTYRFLFKVLNNQTPKKVVVQDISEENPEVLVTDNNPKLERGHWGGQSAPKTKDDPQVAFLRNDHDSVRVYRFTITLADGREINVEQALFYFGLMKSEARHNLGLRMTD